MYYRLLLLKFEYLNVKCHFPIILNWSETAKADYEMEVMNRIEEQLKETLGVNKVFYLHNQVNTIDKLQEQFNEIIGSVDFNPQTSELRVLRVLQKNLVPLSEEDLKDGVVEKFVYNQMNFPVRVFDPGTGISSKIKTLPLITIE